jgi:hypothetical protein
MIKMKEKYGNKENLRKPFLAPCQPVLDVFRIHAISEHKRFEEYFYELIKEGFKVKYGIYPEEEANGCQQETMDMKPTIEGKQPAEGKNEGKTKTFSLLNPIKNIGRRKQI